MMRLSTFNATAIVPTLARIVLCAAFLTMGWNKLMYTHEFTGDAAATLIELGVVDSTRPVANIVPSAWRADDDAENAAIEQTPAAQPPAEQTPQPPPAQPPARPTVQLPDIPEPPADVLREDPVTGQRIVEAKRLHTVTIAVANAGWGQPVIMAWIATLTELIGGALLLLGLFSRIWGLGLAIAMGTAFYLTSLPALIELGPFAMAADLANGYAAYNRMYVQMGLGLLALGIFLTGPGPLSLDRLLFRPNHPKDPEFDEMQ